MTGALQAINKKEQHRFFFIDLIYSNIAIWVLLKLQVLMKV